MVLVPGVDVTVVVIPIAKFHIGKITKITDKLIVTKNKNCSIKPRLFYICVKALRRTVKTCRADKKSIPALENRTLACDEGHSRERLSSARDLVLLCKHSWMAM